MNNQKFNYKYQYENWHQVTEESLKNDLNTFKVFCDTHNAFPTDKDSKILELGCGMGRFLLMLSKYGYKNILGIDIDSSQVEIAKKYNLNVLLYDALEFLKKDKNTYDTIYCLDILEHISKQLQIDFLEEIYKHLTPQGFAVFQIPNAIAPLGNYFRYIDFTHTVSYTDISVSFLCKNAGFEYIVVRPQHQESEEIQELKRPWANLYKKEFGLENFILTPNLVIILFKDKKIYKNYLSKVKPINNIYTHRFKYKNFWEKIFSIKNFYPHKIITIIGIKLSFKIPTV